MFKGKKIAVVIPAYNEEQLLIDTIESVPEYVDRIYVVNDGSTDRTGQIMLPLSYKAKIECITHSHNMGVGAAIRSGYCKAINEEMDITVVMAGDNQMDPSYMDKLITAIIEGKADYSKGDRLSQPENHTGMSNWRLLGNWFLTWLTRIATGNWQLTDPQNGYAAISHSALKKINVNTMYSRYGYCNDLLVKLSAAGCRVIDVPIPAKYGNEKSDIIYSTYIPRVSWLLLKDFVWRLKKQISK